ncbi:coadhesin-like [Mya arenaria]|uniref:coadhesin-like n=1 Tax=Mya arenaria TaxID=6604 RepID=UPI0022E511A7|nr:coadhesin-like [Mya arenaria]
MNSVLNICQSTQQAKLVCPNFCGLCNIVDGHWSDWSVWSGCDVTCGNGEHSRDRTCTYPAPAHGGLDCTGLNADRKTCNNNPCPIHGGWSFWSSWGSCSVTCDVGMKRRDRSCSNPYPGIHGNPCFGDARDDAICKKMPCANGGWSDWESWSACPVTCDVGLRSRQRFCNNPFPSMLGQYCQGKSDDYIVCNTKPCKSRVTF